MNGVFSRQQASFRGVATGTGVARACGRSWRNLLADGRGRSIRTDRKFVLNLGSHYSVKFLVRYCLLCNDVREDPGNLLRLDILGLMTHIRSKRVPSFPVAPPRICVLVLMTDCQGPAEITLRIVQSETGRIIFRNQPRPMQFVSIPREAVGIKFHIKNCTFPAEGLYWVEFLIDEVVAVRQALSLTS